LQKREQLPLPALSHHHAMSLYVFADGCMMLPLLTAVATVTEPRREMQQPNSNTDDLAVVLRDTLMPLRVWWMRHGPGGPTQFRKALEHKKLGVPGRRYYDINTATCTTSGPGM